VGRRRIAAQGFDHPGVLGGNHGVEVQARLLIQQIRHTLGACGYPLHLSGGYEGPDDRILLRSQFRGFLAACGQQDQTGRQKYRCGQKHNFLEHIAPPL